jgi:hypothetical protein
MGYMNKLGKSQSGSRGFPFVEFLDRYNHKCSMQVSSLATEQCIWLGVDDVEPKVMWKDAAKVGVKTNETCGWVPYPIPEEVLLSSRMHLTREQVEALIGHLQSWLDSGKF